MEITVINQTVLTDGSAVGDLGIISPTLVPSVRELGIYAEFSAGTMGGTLIVEAAYKNTYGGTWAPLATIPWSAANAVTVAQITGAHGAMRVRITTAITGGTVTVRVIGN